MIEQPGYLPYSVVTRIRVAFVCLIDLEALTGNRQEGLDFLERNVTDC